MGYKEEFIEFMLGCGVLKFGDFTTKSGRKTPFFINTGFYKTGEQIAKLGEFYAQTILQNIGNNFDTLYGPAYKGIPLAVSVAIALQNKHQLNICYTFNRKEAKDHGEGGNLIGYTPKDRDRIVIVEDVITAGTSVRESYSLLKSVAEVNIDSVVVSVDRMEKGLGEQSALQEIEREFGIKTYAIVTIDEIVAYLYNREINGKVFIDDALKSRIDEYRTLYGVSL